MCDFETVNLSDVRKRNIKIKNNVFEFPYQNKITKMNPKRKSQQF